MKDSHADLLPTLKMQAALYLSRAGRNTGNPVTVNYLVDNYNPLGALLTIKSQQIAVDIAKTMHKQKVSRGIAEIAKAFVEIEARNKLIRSQNAVKSKWDEKIAYLRSMEDRGKVEKLWVDRWELSRKEIGLKIETLKAERDEYIDKLKHLIGYHPDYFLPLDTRDAVNQILGGFNGKGITFADVQGRNLGLKILAKREQLESNLVSATYVAILPQPLIIFQDISNQVDRTSGLNLLVGFKYNIWDGFQGVRRIKRQKMEARQAKIEREEKSRDMYEAYKKLRSTMDMIDRQEALLREQKGVAQATTKQMKELARMYPDIRPLQPGQSPDSLPRARVLDAELKELESKAQSVDAWQSRAAALVELATLAGGLNNYNARIRH